MIVSIITTGTYYCPWFPYTLASIYEHSDKIVVVNAGHDLEHFNSDIWNIPLEQASADIKEFDLNGKIREYKNITLDDLSARHRFDVMSQVEMNRNKHKIEVYDIRGIVMTLATQRACELGADWILKIDHDQVMYPDFNNYRSGSYMAYQYEFTHKIEEPTQINQEYPYNDGIFTYKPSPDDWYQGSGGPQLKSNDCERKFEDVLHDAHLRGCKPITLTDNEWKQFTFQRELWNYYNNKYGVFNQQLRNIVNEIVDVKLEDCRRFSKATAKPPEICLYNREQLLKYVSGKIPLVA